MLEHEETLALIDKAHEGDEDAKRSEERRVGKECL